MMSQTCVSYMYTPTTAYGEGGSAGFSMICVIVPFAARVGTP